MQCHDRDGGWFENSDWMISAFLRSDWLNGPFTYSLNKSRSVFFCSVGESGEGGLSLSITVGPAASRRR